ncbi:MAG TPA: hypothetical protein VJ205_00375 [Gammaproteobacteria bacterium]|nr:hypothetical protein [Gammaproteobacteria bacterium]
MFFLFPQHKNNHRLNDIFNKAETGLSMDDALLLLGRRLLSPGLGSDRLLVPVTPASIECENKLRLIDPMQTSRKMRPKI